MADREPPDDDRGVDIDALARMLSREANRMRDSYVRPPTSVIVQSYAIVNTLPCEQLPFEASVALAVGSKHYIWSLSRIMQGGTTSEEDDEGYVTDPEPEPRSDAASGGADSADPDVLPNAPAGSESANTAAQSVEEFRQQLARKESGAEAGTSGRPASAFGLEASSAPVLGTQSQCTVCCRGAFCRL